MSASEREGADGNAQAGRAARRSALAAWPLPAGRLDPARLVRIDWRDWLARQLDVERSARTAFHLAPMAMMLGILLVHGAGLRWPVAVTLAGSAALLLFGAWRDGGSARAASLALGFILLGTGLAGLELRRTNTIIFSGEATVRIEGRVVWRDRDERGRYRYRVRIAATERPELSRPPGEAQIFVSSRHEPIPVGGLYKGLVRLRPPSGPAYPGAYDFAFGPYFEGLGAYGFSLGAPEAPDTAASAGAPTMAMRITELRLAISDRIRSVIGGAEGAVAAALITGERSGIPEEINVWLRATGLSHVLSISGMHMALVAGFVMMASRAILAAIPGLALAYPTKKWAAGLALLVSTLYLVISGDNVATERSYIMLAIMLVAVFFDRPALTLRNVAIAAIVVIIATPHAVMTASFQMSFGATAALVGAYGAFARWRSGRNGASERPRGRLKIAIFFLAGLAVSLLIAGTATGPFAAYHFHRMAPFGVFANVLALPIFSLWIMPLALVSVLAMPFGLDAPLLWLMGHGLTLVFEIAHVFSEVLPDSPIGRLTGGGVLLLTAALLAAAFLSSRLRWLALPLAVLGLVVAPDRSPYPELLIFEDGKNLALTDAGGRLVYLRDRPNGFVSDQWERAFVPREMRRAPGAALAAEAAAVGFRCEGAVCRGTSRTGLRIVWTDDYEKTGLACDEADVAIVARAIRLRSCRSGAILVTLRTLRESGSLAVSRSPESGEAVATASINDPPAEWNRHRFEPWPEYWRKPETDEAEPGAEAKDDADAGQKAAADEEPEAGEASVQPERSRGSGELGLATEAVQ